MSFAYFLKLIFSNIRDLFKFLLFEYKHDKDVRNLYIEHAKKLDKIFSLHYAHTIMPDEMRQLLFEASKEATLYLHKDIVKLMEELQNLLFELDNTYFSLEGLPVCEKRNKICDEQYDLKMKIHDIQKNYLIIYRKQILNDGFSPKEILNKLDENFVKKDKVLGK